MQAETSVVYDARRRADEAAAGVRAARQGRGVAAEIGLARRESPHRGQVLLGLAKILTTEMPHTLARLRDGSLSEFRATLIARESACLPVELRMFLDEEVCADPAGLDGVGTRELIGRIRRLVAELEPAAVARRARKAQADRNVTVRPAPDTMTYLTALVPVAQGVAAYAALRKAAEAARAAGDPRSLGQLMSDLLVARITGVAEVGTPEAAPAVPVTVDVVLSDESLAGGHAPAEISADGVQAETVPAEVARHLLAQSADADVVGWFRTLYRNRLGRLVAMSTRSGSTRRRWVSSSRSAVPGSARPRSATHRSGTTTTSPRSATAAQPASMTARGCARRATTPNKHPGGDNTRPGTRSTDIRSSRSPRPATATPPPHPPHPAGANPATSRPAPAATP
ncbi:MAG TPA: DUF222 domain-containing protein [Nocardioides sp.]|nr:DUF222 domain-containing protein [Nocardioides sp.]